MDLNSLRVFNSMYGLGITEEDFVKIEKEVNDISKTGIANMLKAKGKLVYVSHDDKSNIMIKKNTKDLIIPSRILCKTMITFEPVPKEIYTLHTIARYRSQDWEYKFIADNLEELKDRIVERFVDKYDKVIGNEEQLKAIFWLFDEKFKPVDQKSRKNMSTIVKVFSGKNKRLALIRNHHTYESSCWMGNTRDESEEVEYKAQTFKARDPRYNYVCEGREFKEGIWLDDELLGKVSAAELRIINNKKGVDGEGFLLLTAREYANIQNSIRVEMMTARRQQEDKELKVTMESKAEKDFKNKKKVVRNGISFTHKGISYDDLELKGPNIEHFISRNNIITADNPDFNSIVSSFIDYILESDYINSRGYGIGRVEINFDGEAELKIGKVKAHIKGDKKNVWMILEGIRHRVRKDEIADILRNALGYDEQKEFDEFVKEVSSVSLRLKKVLDNGLSFKIQVSPTSDNDLSKSDYGVFFISLKVEREKSKNYLMLPDKRLKICSMGDMFRLQDQLNEGNWRMASEGYVQRTIKILFKGVSDITPQDVGELIKNGKQQHKDRINRSLEFVKNAVRLTKAIAKNEGWVVKGMSGKEYYVGKDLSVYTWKNNKKDNYLCIIDVDSDTKDLAGRNDCIAKRLLALSKDKIVAKDIYDKGDHVDKYWKTLEVEG